MKSLWFLATLLLSLSLAYAQAPGSAGHHGNAQAGAVRDTLTRSNADAVDLDDDEVSLNLDRARDEHLELLGGGQYSFGYAASTSAREERRNSDGSVQGKYSYTDPDGKLVEIQYSADAQNGFKAEGENVPPRQLALPPYPVQDTPAVAEARAKFLDYYQREWNARKALELIENATATSISPESDSNPTKAPTVYVDSDESQEYNEKVGGAPADAQPLKTYGGQQDDDDTEIIELNDVPSAHLGVPSQTAQVIPGVKPVFPVRSAVQENTQGSAPGSGPSGSYSLNFQVGNQAQNSQTYSQGGQSDILSLPLQDTRGSGNQLNGETFNKGPAYFYYVGTGGLPYYVTSLPTRSNTPISVRATELGAVPAAAVHDSQTPHHGGSILQTKQSPAIYVQVNQDYSDPGSSSPFKSFNFRNSGSQTNNVNDNNKVVLLYPASFPFGGYRIVPY